MATVLARSKIVSSTRPDPRAEVVLAARSQILDDTDVAASVMVLEGIHGRDGRRQILPTCHFVAVGLPAPQPQLLIAELHLGALLV